MRYPRLHTKREKISPRSEEYLARLKRNQAELQLTDHVLDVTPFGLKAVICHTQMVKDAVRIKEEYPDISPDELEKRQHHFRGMMESYAKLSLRDFAERVKYRRESAQQVLQYMLEDEKIQQALEPLVRRIRQVDKSLYGTLKPEEILLRSIFSGVSVDFANRVYTLIKRKRIPLDVWVDMLARHNAAFIERQDTFKNSLLPRLKNRFLERIKQLEARSVGSVLPPLDVVKRKLDLLVIDLQDGIEAKFDDRSGAYMAQYKRVFLDSDLASEEFFEKLEDVFVHEMNHVLSGHTVVSRDHTMLSRVVDDSYIIDQEIQVGFRRQGVYRWLNEGFTECMTSYITGRPPASYIAEVELCEYLATKGKNIIPLQVFADAYYEDYDPTQKPTIPKWRALRQAINESFSPAFLTKLTKIVMVAGPKLALHMLENEGVEGFL